MQSTAQNPWVCLYSHTPALSSAGALFGLIAKATYLALLALEIDRSAVVTLCLC